MRILKPRSQSEFEIQSRLYTRLKADGVDVYGEVVSCGVNGYPGNHRFDLVVFDGEEVFCIIEIKRIGQTWGTKQEIRYVRTGYPIILFSSTREENFALASKLIREKLLDTYTEIVDEPIPNTVLEVSDQGLTAARIYFEFQGGRGDPPRRWVEEFSAMLVSHPYLIEVLNYLQVDDYWGDGKPRRKNILRTMPGEAVKNLKDVLSKNSGNELTLIGSYEKYKALQSAANDRSGKL